MTLSFQLDAVPSEEVERAILQHRLKDAKSIQEKWFYMDQLEQEAQVKE